MTSNLCPSLSWHFLPIFLGVTAFCGMVITYTLAKQNCHVEKWFLPYISYTGTEHPESSIFGLILNIEGFLGIIVVILAWRFMRHMDHRNHLNSAALVSGILSCFGVIMVGNFQVSTNKVPHYIGAGLAFIVGTIYCTVASVLMHKLHRSVQDKTSWSKFVCMLRFTASGAMIISIVILMVLGVLRLELGTVHKIDNPTPEPDPNPVYRFPNGSCVPIIRDVPVYKRYLDLAGSVTEWLLTVCLLFSLSLYAYEFKYFHNVKIILKKRGTELSITTLQHKRCNTTSPSDQCDYTSPDASLLHTYSDTTLLHSEKLTNNRSPGFFLTVDKQSCRNNNKDPPLGERDPGGFDVSKSLPNITSSLNKQP